MGLVAKLTKSIIGEPITLPAYVTSAFPELHGLRYRRGGLPTRIAGWTLGQSSVAAITLWRTVFLAPRTRPDAALLLHEFRHVQQFLERKSFPLRYIAESLRRGYYSNRYEMDARRFAAVRLARHFDPDQHERG